MDHVLNGMSAADLAAMAKAGPARVRSKFADVQMAQTLEGILDEIEGSPRPPARVAMAICIAGVLAVIGAVAVKMGLERATWK